MRLSHQLVPLFIQEVETRLGIGKLNDRTTWKIACNKARNRYDKAVPYWDIRRAVSLYLKENTDLSFGQIGQYVVGNNDHSSIIKKIEQARFFLSEQEEKFLPIWNMVCHIGNEFSCPLINATLKWAETA